MIKEIIVVEGKDDTVAVKRAVEADTIETGGSAINADVLERIRLAQARRGVIIFTDPDQPGEKIRKTIAAGVPGCKHAFLDRDAARRGRTIGVENASPEAIRRALASVFTEQPDAEPQVTWSDLLAAGLVGREDSAARRERVGKRLGFGYCNAKQFYHRCRAFRIDRDEFARAIKEAEAN